MDKIKVSLVCHFSNASVREHLPLDNRKLYNIIRKLIGLPISSVHYGDLASWDSNIIENLSKRNDIDLNVISAHTGMKKRKVSFTLGGVKYHFVNSDMATFLKHVLPSPKVWRFFNPLRPLVQKIIRNIQPDIVVLVGAENPHISDSINGLSEYPIFVKTQTIYNNPNRVSYQTFNKINGYVEKLILKNNKYFSVTTFMHYKLFRSFNKEAYNFNWMLATTFPNVQEIEQKQYDFVNFAVKISEAKGYYDAIKAVAIVKKKYPAVKLNIVGQMSNHEKVPLTNLIKEYDVEDNVEYTPFFETQDQLFQHLQNSKYAVLPYKLDYIASTTRQAMHYGLPVICYKTEGTPQLNQGEQRILIAEMNDVKELAEKMIMLLDDSELGETLKTRAKKYIDKLYDNTKITEHLVSVFKAIIDNYNNGTPISESLLFEPTEK